MEHTTTTQPKIFLKYGMTREQIAAKLQLDEHAFRRLLKQIGITHSYKLLPLEIEKIRVEFGVDYM